MKKIRLLLTTTFIIMISALTSISASPTCETSCDSGNCSTNHTQTSTGWSMTVTCGTTEYPYSGTGDYEGTICGGVEPCNVPMQS